MDKEINIIGIFKISPQKLYPTVGISSIEQDLIRECKRFYEEQDKQKKDIIVFSFDDVYYIYEGHEQVLAATNCECKTVEVLEIDRANLACWSKTEDLLFALQAIGMTALYDFEAIGAFSYKDYPKYYKK